MIVSFIYALKHFLPDNSITKLYTSLNSNSYSYISFVPKSLKMAEKKSLCLTRDGQYFDYRDNHD